VHHLSAGVIAKTYVFSTHCLILNSFIWFGSGFEGD